MKTRVESIMKEKERVITVAVATGERQETENSLSELGRLTETAGGELIDAVIQPRSKLDPKYYIGKGKIEFLKSLCSEHNADTIIFDDELSPSQQKNIQSQLNGVKILDRSSLILHIFRDHARTREAKTQVELAMLEYMLPRLTRQWTHLERQMGGIGARRGVGETQIELDRRMIRKKIAQLKDELKMIAVQRETKRKFRGRHFNVALVGYTNAGKSTLMNLLTDADVGIEDMLFATLDTTVRQHKIDNSHIFYLSDTVGFIQKLPHQLVASFRSTLREVETADLLLKVIDISDPDFRQHLNTIEKVLDDFRIPHKKSITLFNKLDIFDDENNISLLKKDFPDAIAISAARSIGTGRLLQAIKERMDEGTALKRVLVRNQDGKLISLLHRQSAIQGVEHINHDFTVYDVIIGGDELNQLIKNHGLRLYDPSEEEE